MNKSILCGLPSVKLWIFNTKQIFIHFSRKSIQSPKSFITSKNDFWFILTSNRPWSMGLLENIEQRTREHTKKNPNSFDDVLGCSLCIQIFWKKWKPIEYVCSDWRMFKCVERGKNEAAWYVTTKSFDAQSLWYIRIRVRIHAEKHTISQMFEIGYSFNTNILALNESWQAINGEDGIGLRGWWEVNSKCWMFYVERNGWCKWNVKTFTEGMKLFGKWWCETENEIVSETGRQWELNKPKSYCCYLWSYQISYKM